MVDDVNEDIVEFRKFILLKINHFLVVRFLGKIDDVFFIMKFLLFKIIES